MMKIKITGSKDKKLDISGGIVIITTSISKVHSPCRPTGALFCSKHPFGQGRRVSKN